MRSYFEWLAFKQEAQLAVSRDHLLMSISPTDLLDLLEQAFPNGDPEFVDDEFQCGDCEVYEENNALLEGEIADLEKEIDAYADGTFAPHYKSAVEQAIAVLQTVLRTAGVQ